MLSRNINIPILVLCLFLKQLSRKKCKIRVSKIYGVNVVAMTSASCDLELRAIFLVHSRWLSQLSPCSSQFVLSVAFTYVRRFLVYHEKHVSERRRTRARSHLELSTCNRNFRTNDRVSRWNFVRRRFIANAVSAQTWLILCFFDLPRRVLELKIFMENVKIYMYACTNFHEHP